MIREESNSQLSERGNNSSRDIRVRQTKQSANIKQQKAATKALMGMGKPHMLGA
jgi:hypothetical protein